ncbi:protein kinase [Streptomyces sp. NA02950]|uniref:protein kinase domain-containing protein n=1 Tax=Streptomyces sp. NA02950 TaxID=2742137 RepID=UPI00159060A2|nr:protein kinase [Streptomyces sp. NA02950]QKV93177.1 protein kinase [Streptomyces sp. NA02950]
MDEYAGRVLADRYRLPLPPADEYEFVETRALDTYSGQEVHLRQIPLPEVVDAEVVDEEARLGRAHSGGPGRTGGGPADEPAGGGDPAVRRATVAATAAAQLPDHPRLGQVFHVFAESGSLWIVSELVAGRPLAALLAEGTLSPHRAAEIANDILTALRALHAHGWIHRNITTRTVLLCEDGRAMLTGLAAGAAEEALCGYDPVPPPAGADADEDDGPAAEPPARPVPVSSRAPVPAPAAPERSGGPRYRDQGAAGGFPGPRAAPEAGARAGTGVPAVPGGPGGPAVGEREPGMHWVPGARESEPGGGTADPQGAAARAARAGAIAAYAAGARAAARAGVDPSPDAYAEHDPYDERDTDLDHEPGDDRDQDLVGDGASWPGAPDPGARTGGGSWDTDGAPGGATGGGPGTALAAERARQARIVVVGAVSERWAPEQAVPVHENWRLAPPVGPAADLWALGVLLFRAVQGHAPYPEDNAAELVQLVCAEAPAYAEECGPLRPVVESLLRQDPTERPDFEELRGWLRSLIRSAPEPDVGSRTVTVPSIGPGGASDPRRLPVVRRRGWLVRRGRGRPVPSAAAVHGRHKRAKQPKQPRQPRAPRPPRVDRMAQQRPQTSAGAEEQREPHRLGRVLLLVILLALAAAVLYAMMFMPRDKETGGQDRTGSAGAQSAAPSAPHDPAPRSTAPGSPGGKGDSPQPRSTHPAGMAKGFAVRDDPKGFKVAVDEDWTRRGENGRGQIRYLGGDFELLVVAGRDKASEFGGDPMAYQQNREAELDAFRNSSWASSSGLRRIDVGRTAMAEGAFSWRDSSGRDVYARNLAMLIDGRYHVVLVIGPSDERRAVSRYFEQATATYSTTG